MTVLSRRVQQQSEKSAEVQDPALPRVALPVNSAFWGICHPSSACWEIPRWLSLWSLCHPLHPAAPAAAVPKQGGRCWDTAGHSCRKIQAGALIISALGGFRA